MEIWPEHAEPFTLLCNMSSQLLCGPGRAYGLNYAVIDSTAARAGINPPTGQAWHDFRALESEYIAALMGKGK